jgi:hypothetical protein
MGASFPVLNDVDLLTANNYMYPSIAVLALHNNALTGTIPRGLGEMELSESIKEIFVFVSYASFSLLTLFCCVVVDEAYFDFSDNKLTGSIPTELGNQVKIHSFNLAANMLTGTLPSEMGRLSVLGKL